MTDRPLTWDMIPPAELAELKELALRAVNRDQYAKSVCDGKARFENRTQADATIRNKEKRHKIHAYHCPKCGFWHVGSMKNVGRKKKAFRRILSTRRETCE